MPVMEWMAGLWSSLQSIGLTGLFQIAVLACAIYGLFLFFRGTSGAQVMIGLLLLLLVLIGLTQLFSLDVLAWLLRRFWVYLAIAVVIIFQPEIRSALAELGRQPVLYHPMDRRTLVDNLVEAALALAENKVGGLIAVEREIGTRAVQETGTLLNAPVVPELLTTLFFPHTPLHDGGVIISGDRIAAAGCVFPLSFRPDLLKTLGTRHRAAIGLSEETDAVVIVVSEETGTVSVAYRGRLSRGVDGERLQRILNSLLLSERPAVSWWKGVLRRNRPRSESEPDRPPDSHAADNPPTEDARV